MRKIPDKVAVRTGEEDEKQLLRFRAKLFELEKAPAAASPTVGSGALSSLSTGVPAAQISTSPAKDGNGSSSNNNSDSNQKPPLLQTPSWKERGIGMVTAISVVFPSYPLLL